MRRMLIIFGTRYLMDVSPLLVKFQPFWLNTCKMTGKLRLYVKNGHARLKQMLVNCLSPALTEMAPLCRRLYPGNDYILQQDGDLPY
jgi:hypothetical protein